MTFNVNSCHCHQTNTQRNTSQTNNTQSTSQNTASQTGSNGFGLTGSSANNSMIIMLFLQLLLQLLQQIIGQAGGNSDQGGDQSNNGTGNNNQGHNHGDHSHSCNNTINTGSGNDTVNTGRGNDTVNTGAGNDVITGGPGADTYNAGIGDVINLPDGTSFTVGQNTTAQNNNAPAGNNQASGGNTGNTNTTQPNPIAVNNGSRVWGDPHFVGAEGGKYDVQGQAGKTYNILSDSGLQLNSTFASHGKSGATVMGEMGATMGSDQVHVGKDGSLSINGETKTDGTYQLNSGTVTKSGKTVTLKSAEYDVAIKSTGSYLNVDFKSDNVATDGVMPHGLWGQSADGDGKARNGDKGAGAQGGGAIEKLDGSLSAKGDKETVKLYETNGLFDTGFANFNQFNGNSQNAPAINTDAAGKATK